VKESVNEQPSLGIGEEKKCPRDTLYAFMGNILPNLKSEISEMDVAYLVGYWSADAVCWISNVSNRYVLGAAVSSAELQLTCYSSFVTTPLATSHGPSPAR
jgi:hypothetical protein